MPELPRAADRVGHVEVDLRAVERAVALVELVRQVVVVQRALQRGLGAVPHVLGADPLLGPRRELQARLEAELLVDREAEVEAADDLFLDLVLGGEDVRVVLGDVADAQQAVQRAGRLVAVHEALLGVADRQVAVGAPLRRVELRVRRAVHGLQAHRLALDVREVHVVAVHVPVPGLLEELGVVEDRRVDLAVAARRVLGAPQVGQLVPDRHPVREPERRARRELGEHEQLELLAELAVVARARLLEPLEVLGQLVLGRERGAVDAREHLAVRVAAPVGAGDEVSLNALARPVPGACGPRQRSRNSPLR